MSSRTRVPSRGGRILRSLLSMVVVMTGVSLVAPAAQGAFPGSNGFITFDYPASNGTGGTSYDIFRVAPDGSGRANLTNSAETDEFEPIVSPDGGRIAFTRTDPSVYWPYDVWVMNADGTNQINITGIEDPSNVYYDADPAWSPDGQKLVFTSNRAGGNKLFIVDVATGATTPINTGLSMDHGFPVWSPTDPNLIAFQATSYGETGFDIYTFNLATSQVTPVVTEFSNDEAPDFSPDGKRLAFHSSFYYYYGEVVAAEIGGDADIQVVNIDGTGLTNLSNDGEFSTDERYAAFSPDGASIIYTTAYANPPGQIFRIPSTGGPATLVADGGNPDWASGGGIAPESNSGSVPPGGTLTTDTEGDGATSGDPVETGVTSPSGGSISIEETNIEEPQPDNWIFFGQQVNITAPAATPDNPLRINITIDESLIPEGQTARTVGLFRNGVEVPNCPSEFPIADPDPCIFRRVVLSGDASLTVLTSRASAWNMGLRAPRQIGGGGGGGIETTPAPSPSDSGSPSASASPSESTSASPVDPTPSDSGSGPASSPPVDTVAPQVQADASSGVISPNGDGRLDNLRVEAVFSENVDWVFSVIPSAASRQAAGAVFTRSGSGRNASIVWDGSGASDGVYTWRLTGTDSAGNAATPETGPLVIDTLDPGIQDLRVRPKPYRAGDGKMRIAFSLDEDANVSLIIRRFGRRVVKLIDNEEMSAGDHTLTWAGKLDSGRRAKGGEYLLRLRASDAGENRSKATKDFRVR